MKYKNRFAENNNRERNIFIGNIERNAGKNYWKIAEDMGISYEERVNAGIQYMLETNYLSAIYVFNRVLDNLHQDSNFMKINYLNKMSMEFQRNKTHGKSDLHDLKRNIEQVVLKEAAKRVEAGSLKMEDFGQLLTAASFAYGYKIAKVTGDSEVPGRIEWDI